MAARRSSARAGPKPTRSSPRQTAKCPSTPTTCSSLRWPAHELGQDHRVTRSTAEQFIKVLATLQALGASFGTPQRRTRPTVSGDLDPSEPVVVMMCIGRGLGALPSLRCEESRDASSDALDDGFIDTLPTPAVWTIRAGGKRMFSRDGRTYALDHQRTFVSRPDAP